MSESWKEKAKTDDLEIAVQLERILRQHSVEDADAFDRFYERLKIAESKLEDAQKEYDDLNESWQKCYTEWERKRLELKQKLQQIFKEFPDINSKDYALHNGWTNHDLKDRYGLFIADVQAWKKKFEEWLKEEKEAQPKEEKVKPT
jgi:hypothetical protein